MRTPITQGAGIINAYDVSGSFGGPIKRDRLWFFGSYRKFEPRSARSQGIVANAYAGDASHWDYLADTSIAARPVQGRDDLSGRVTAQVTREEPRHVLARVPAAAARARR